MAVRAISPTGSDDAPSFRPTNNVPPPDWSSADVVVVVESSPGSAPVEPDGDGTDPEESGGGEPPLHAATSRPTARTAATRRRTTPPPRGSRLDYALIGSARGRADRPARPQHHVDGAPASPECQLGYPISALRNPSESGRRPARNGPTVALHIHSRKTIHRTKSNTIGFAVSRDRAPDEVRLRFGRSMNAAVQAFRSSHRSRILRDRARSSGEAQGR